MLRSSATSLLPHLLSIDEIIFIHDSTLYYPSSLNGIIRSTPCMGMMPNQGSNKFNVGTRYYTIHFNIIPSSNSRSSEINFSKRHSSNHCNGLGFDLYQTFWKSNIVISYASYFGGPRFESRLGTQVNLKVCRGFP